jgi:hypothetical protein
VSTEADLEEDNRKLRQALHEAVVYIQDSIEIKDHQAEIIQERGRYVLKRLLSVKAQKPRPPSPI